MTPLDQLSVAVKPSGVKFIRAAGIVVTAVLVALWFFAPALVSLRAQWIAPTMFPTVETGRGFTVLAQAEHPGRSIEGIHAGIRWRILIPGVAWALALPASLHLAAYPLGAVAAAAYASHIFCMSSQRTWLQLLAVLCLVTNAWFFTSFHWFGYADGWVCLGLLVVAFAHHRSPVLLCGLLLPWADDRFLIGIPAALAVAWTRRRHEPAARSFESDCMFVAVAVSSIVLRVVIENVTGESSLMRFAAAWQPGSIATYAAAVWMCWRCIWLAVAAAFTTAHDRLGQAVWAAVVAGSFFAAMLTNNDLSRAGVVLAPPVVLGLTSIMHWTRSTSVLTAMCVGNLLLPATHVVVNVAIPIRSLPNELCRLSFPPPQFNAATHARHAAAALRSGDVQEATRRLAVARSIDPSHNAVAAMAAAVRFRIGDRAGAIDQLRMRIREYPADSESRAMLAIMAEAAGIPVASEAMDGGNSTRETPAPWDACACEWIEWLRFGR